MKDDHDHIPEVLQLASKFFRKLLEFSLYFLKLSQELQFLQDSLIWSHFEMHKSCAIPIPNNKLKNKLL